MLGEPDLGARSILNLRLTDTRLPLGNDCSTWRSRVRNHSCYQGWMVAPMRGVPTQVRLTLDFPKNEIRVYLFLGEIRAQEMAVKLRQRAHLGMVMTRVGLHRRAWVEQSTRRLW